MCAARTTYTYDFIKRLIAQCSNVAPIGFKLITSDDKWEHTSMPIFAWENTGLLVADPEAGGRWMVTMSIDENVRYRRALQNVVNRVTPATLKACIQDAQHIPMDSKEKFNILVAIVIDKFRIEQQYFESFLEFVRGIQSSLQSLKNLEKTIVQRVCTDALDRTKSQQLIKNLRVLSHFYKHYMIPYKGLQSHIQWCVRTSSELSIDALNTCVSTFATRMSKEEPNEVKLMIASVQKRVVDALNGRPKYIGMDIIETLEDAQKAQHKRNVSIKAKEKLQPYRPPIQKKHLGMKRTNAYVPKTKRMYKANTHKWYKTQ